MESEIVNKLYKLSGSIWKEKQNRLHVNHIIGIFSMSEEYHFAFL